MSKNSIWLLSILSVVILASCQRVQENTIIEESLSSQVFLNDSVLTSPGWMMSTGKMLVISNTSKADTLIDIFDNEGKSYASLLKKGEGPDEALFIESIQYDDRTKAFYVPDILKHVLFKITESGADGYIITTDYDPTSNETDTTDAITDLALSSYIGRMANDIYIAANHSKAGRLALINKDGTVFKMVGTYPDKKLIDERLTDIAHIDLYGPIIRVSPNGQFAAAVYSGADILTLVAINGDSIVSYDFEKALPNDIFIMNAGSDYVQGIFTDKSMLYSQDLTLSNEHVFQLYIGLSDAEMRNTDFFRDTHRSGTRQVNVYDRQGNLCRKISLDHCVKHIAVTPDEKYLYALTESSTDGYTVLRYEL